MPPPSSAGSTSPAGREVAAGFVATFLELTDRRGLDRASLTHGLVLSEPGRPRPFARIPWDDYAALLERVEAEVGSSGVEAIAEEMIQGSRFFTSLASRLVDVEALLRFGFERLAPATYRNVGCRLDVSRDRTLRAEYVIPPRDRGSLAFGHGTLASMRAYPRLLGQPDLVMEAELHAHGGVLRCALPPAGAPLVQLARALRPRAASAADGAARSDAPGSPPRPLAHDLPDDLVDAGLSDAAAEAGQRLAAHDDLAALAGDVIAFTRERFCARSATLWVRHAPGAPLRAAATSLAPAGSRAPTSRAVRPLLIGGREVGRLELDRDDSAWPHELELVLPWIALGIDRCSRPARPASPRGDVEDAELVARAAARFELTSRETAVVGLLVRGLANKEIAAALGCSVKNIESALTLALHKVGVANRTALVGAVLAPHHAPTA